MSRRSCSKTLLVSGDVLFKRATMGESLIPYVAIPSQLACWHPERAVAEDAPSGEKAEPAERGDGTERSDTGQGEHVEAAGEEHDSGEHEPRGGAGRGGAARDQPRDGEQAERVVHVVARRSLERRKPLGGQAPQGVRAEGAGGDEIGRASCRERVEMA